MVNIVNGNRIAEEILADLRLKISDLRNRGVVPKLVVFLVGKNRASVTYTKKKQETGESIGVSVEVKNFPENISQDELIGKIQEINRQRPDGIIIQLPLPKHLDKQKVLDAIDPLLDVDCLTSTNKQRLVNGQELRFFPPAAAAILKILEHYRVKLEGAQVLLVGAGDLVGKPLAALLRRRKISFELANSKTANLSELTARADVIITGVGKPGLIRSDMIKDGAVIIDAGTSESHTGKLKGDVDFASVSQKAGILSSVPGGVGPVTVAMLLRNVVDSALDPVRNKISNGT